MALTTIGYFVSCEPLLVMRHFLPFLKKQEIEMDFFNAVNGIWTTRKGPIHLLSSFPPKLNHLLVKMQKQKCLKMQQIFLKEIYKVAYQILGSKYMKDMRQVNFWCRTTDIFQYIAHSEVRRTPELVIGHNCCSNMRQVTFRCLVSGNNFLTISFESVYSRALTKIAPPPPIRQNYTQEDLILAINERMR